MDIRVEIPSVSEINRSFLQCVHFCMPNQNAARGSFLTSYKITEQCCTYSTHTHFLFSLACNAIWMGFQRPHVLFEYDNPDLLS